MNVRRLTKGIARLADAAFGSRIRAQAGSEPDGAYDVSRAFFAEVVAEARQRRLLSADHFTVGGTLLEAWASLKSYRPRDVPGNERGTRGGPSPRSCSDT